MEQRHTSPPDRPEPNLEPQRAPEARRVRVASPVAPSSPSAGPVRTPRFILNEREAREKAAAAQLVPARRVPRPSLPRRPASESPDAFGMTRRRRTSTDFGESQLPVSVRTVEIPRGESLERARNFLSDLEIPRRETLLRDDRRVYERERELERDDPDPLREREQRELRIRDIEWEREHLEHREREREPLREVRVIESEPTQPVRKKAELWTEITKDLVTRDAIEHFGYEFEETDNFFYILQHLKYEDVVELVRVSDAIREGRNGEKATIRAPSPIAPERVERVEVRIPADGKDGRHVDEYVWDVSRSRDRTVHLEFELVQDTGSRLDELFRLIRLGHFKAAADFFNANLREERRHPYVFVQYTRLLLESTNYKAVMALTEPDELKNVVLKMNWDLTMLTAEVHYKGASMRKIDTELFIVSSLFGAWFQDEERLRHHTGSTEIHTICLALNLWAKYPQMRPGDWVIADSAWTFVYQTLLEEERVWDFRDLFVSTCAVLGCQKACVRFFGSSTGSSSAASLKQLMDDWLHDTNEESANLALLDILAEIGFGMGTSTEAQINVDIWSHYSNSIASTIAKQDAELLLTRPYLRWSLAKIHMATGRKERPRPDAASELPKPPRDQIRAVDLPIYSPTGDGPDDWQLFALPSHANNSIQVVLDAAHGLGDWEIESTCRKMLLRRSQDPVRHLDRLVQLQQTVQHDQLGYLQTLLFSYNLADTEDRRKSLRRDILDVETWEDFPATLQWARFMILRDVSDQRHADSWLRSAENLLDTLPTYGQRAIQRPAAEDKGVTKGKTRIPARLVSKQAVIALGYPYSEEGNTIVIHQALKQDKLDELEKLTEQYRAEDTEFSIERRFNNGRHPSYRWDETRFAKAEDRHLYRSPSPPLAPDRHLYRRSPSPPPPAERREEDFTRKQITASPWNETSPEEREWPTPVKQATLAEAAVAQTRSGDPRSRSLDRSGSAAERVRERVITRGRRPESRSVSPTESEQRFRLRDRVRTMSHERPTPSGRGEIRPAPDMARRQERVAAHPDTEENVEYYDG